LTNEDAHRLAREKGVSRVLYAFIRSFIEPFLRLYFRMRISGAENIPDQGAAIIAPNHKSFFDSFFIALATRRHLRYMGKTELFEGRRGRFLVRLGAFPVRRGEADQDALDTARTILEQGGLLALFPEGTRVRDPEKLGTPKRGVARLALETGAPMIPTAITGTDHLWLGPIAKPKRVQVAFSKPVTVEQFEATPEAAQELLEEEVWPEVHSQFGRLRSRPGLIAAGLAALGVGGVLAARQRAGARSKSRLARLPSRKPKGRAARLRARASKRR
jgi:1-acyl-sn-glycerol-3-phosphate acyltransferase